MRPSKGPLTEVSLRLVVTVVKRGHPTAHLKHHVIENLTRKIEKHFPDRAAYHVEVCEIRHAKPHEPCATDSSRSSVSR